MNVLTIVTLVYLAIVIIRAYIKGFTGTIFSMLFLVLVIGTTAVAAPHMTELFKGSENLQEFYGRKSREFVERGGAGSISIGRDASPGAVASAAVNLALGVAGVNRIGVEDLTAYLMSISATAVTFILAAVGWFIISIILGRIRKIRGIGMVDHLLGIPLGAAKGLLFVWLVLGVISLISFTGPGIKLAAQVAESPVLTFLYNNNLLAMGFRRIVMGGMM